MDERSLLMIPGPTNVAPSVLSTLARPTVSHISSAFAGLLKQTVADLGLIFKTKSSLILPLAGPGTLGSEVAPANVLEPRDRVLVVSNGYFADRPADVATTLGAKVDRLDLYTAAMKEVESVATAKRINLAKDLVSRTVAQADRMNKSTKPSMLRDLERGKRLEIDALNGSISRFGRQLSVPTPVNDFIYSSLKLQDLKVAGNVQVATIN